MKDIKQEMKKRIQSFSSLKKNWDSYGALPIFEENTQKALEVVDWFEEGSEEFFKVYPTRNGGINFESDSVIFSIENEKIEIYYIPCSEL